ncbi:TMEM165/GDT1 family protein [Natrinema sp. 1APR25-10V2]|uniref:TMEM165/GDT1 family protein n=1 Tax=Natrinema sp. 1APR25-10V2 TaxID=2951081 RepID=UPI002876469E|nr:TMEM165/GDT1 family protein [Natrinema sp. 1APR25-10V2]MDS0477974.1 TMEM165/GDT1 family protein [Natrinema sp. 1APR25-10V2]
MTGWLELLIIAFVLQLSVLPGEKVQFIIAGLSTRYNPWIVVAAAGSAFAGWTALEILFGAAIKGVLAPVYLDAITAALFLIFAVLLVRSAPNRNARAVATNGGVPMAESVDISIRGYEVPPYLRGFVPIFLLMTAGEFGDKTQLVTIGLAVQYGARPAIWAGEMLAIIPVSIANALFFHHFSHRFDARLAHFAGAGLFLFFGLDTILQLLTGFSVWETIVEGISSVVLALV